MIGYKKSSITTRYLVYISGFMHVGASHPPLANASTKRRTSVASYRAEATFFQTLADSDALGAIAPRVLWVHVDDRRYGCLQSNGSGVPSGGGEAEPGVEGGGGFEGREGRGSGEEEEIEALRESSFMMITGGWTRW